jgi:DNA modification methylase
VSTPDPAAGRALEFLRPERLARLSASRLRGYEEAAFRYWRARGFPYPKLSDSEIDTRFRSFVHSRRPVFGPGRSLTWSPLGIGLANHFHPHMWHIECQYFRSPVEVFHNDDFLRQCIARSIRINRDRMPLNANNMRVMLSTFINTKRVSNFRPTVARALYKRYSTDGDLIIDPSAGFGGRMLGLLPLKRSYLGIEPNAQSVGGLRKMLECLRGKPDTCAQVTILEGRSEEVLQEVPSRSAALVINSPPYFARERYSRDPSQSWIRYPDYENWKRHFLEAQVRQIHRILKRGGLYCLNVENTETHQVADDAFQIASKFFRRYYTYRLMIGSVPYHRNGQRGGYRSEPLVIFQKRR